MREPISDSESFLDSSLDSESSTKRSKGKGRAVDTPFSQMEEEIHKPTSTGWNDIPEWEEGKESPLMKLPGETMDKIFCVRPELGVCLMIKNKLNISYATI
jgi:hypothetical protein